jgi:hypothetical protein
VQRNTAFSDIRAFAIFNSAYAHRVRREHMTKPAIIEGYRPGDAH